MTSSYNKKMHAKGRPTREAADARPKRGQRTNEKGGDFKETSHCLEGLVGLDPSLNLCIEGLLEFGDRLLDRKDSPFLAFPSLLRLSLHLSLESTDPLRQNSKLGLCGIREAQIRAHARGLARV